MICVVTSKLGAPVLGLLLSLYIAIGSGVAGSASSPACGMSVLTLGIGPEISEATGQNTLALRLVNRMATSCFLKGYLNVVAYDRRGMIPFTVRHGGDQMITPRRPTRVVVRRNRAAFVLLNHYRCDRGNLREATSLRIRLKGITDTESTSLKIAGPYRTLSYCGRGDPGSILTVSPFEPTIRAALRG